MSYHYKQEELVVNILFHKGELRITFILSKNSSLMRTIKQLPNIKYDDEFSYYYLPFMFNYEKYLAEIFSNRNRIIEPIVRKRLEKNDYRFTIYILYNENDRLFYIKSHYKFKKYIAQLDGAFWDTKNAIWTANASKSNFEQLESQLISNKIDYLIIKSKFSLIKPIKKQAFDKLPKIKQEQYEKIEYLKQWMLQKRYSKSTIDSYTHSLTIFFRYLNSINISEEDVKQRDIEGFNNNYILKNGYSSKTQNQFISAIKTYYLKMLRIKQDNLEIERPREEFKLPKIIAIEDIEATLKKIRNIKHKTALTVVYALGLRRSELINLKVEDIDFDRKAVNIINAKGKKDRTLPLPKPLSALLNNYIGIYNPKNFLIEGQEEGSQYSATSLANIFKKYFKSQEKYRNFTLHTLRHSYATHLLDMGVDLRIIQELLGHKSSKTTEIYTFVSMRKLQSIRNPLDDFEI
jgi:site-specific recombinase XerD